MPTPCGGDVSQETGMRRAGPGAIRERIPMPETHSQERHAPSPSRASCPPSDVIIDYGLNDTTDDVRRLVDDHIETCHPCAIKVRALRAALMAKFGPPSPQDSTLKEGE
jgi:hypothetical protein